jgi:hypothetical protein
MYEAYNPETGERERVDLDELQRRLDDGSLVSSLEQKRKRRTSKEAAEDEDKG